ncbi:alpha-2,8-polysialyltransferase family protein [Rhizobium sp. TRM95111]|uniref:alpha-2,8-polysialyltransferase family protein n=1 Tax=Rhizobium alarense TaxID=2846851 RepID=UPI001F328FF6|nr:alpha-2,8-polysialyltransferase family protein [Rhizobium alarense]MCF3640367.1 alpha-2,8-polysialyltransferase family protein [Rhizobium alarense]
MLYVYVASTRMNLRVCTEFARGEPRARKVLFYVDTGSAPELRASETKAYLERTYSGSFDEIVYFNDLCQPYHPASEPAYTRQIVSAIFLKLGFSSAVRVYLTSLQAYPALGIAGMFPGAELHYYGDGLMSFSPPRATFTDDIIHRLTDAYHLDFIAEPSMYFGLDVGARTHRIDCAGLFPAAKAAMGQGHAPATALLVGQCFEHSGMMSQADEIKLWLSAFPADFQWPAFIERVAFKPHPRMKYFSSQSILAGLRKRFPALAVEELQGSDEVEDLAGPENVVLAVGIFSTSLFFLKDVLGVPVLQFGCRDVYRRLAPFENSNRIPLFLAEHLIPDMNASESRALLASTSAAELQAAYRKIAARHVYDDMVKAGHFLLGFAMQPAKFKSKVSLANGLAAPASDETLALLFGSHSSSLDNIRGTGFRGRATKLYLAGATDEDLLGARPQAGLALRLLLSGRGTQAWRMTGRLAQDIWRGVRRQTSPTALRNGMTALGRFGKPRGKK